MGTFLDATGNFGIGTETPGQKLEVVGNISAKWTTYCINLLILTMEILRMSEQ